MLAIQAALPRTGRSRSYRYAGLLTVYPAAEDISDCGLVGRAEVIRMAGYNPEVRAGVGWFRSQVDRGMLPPHDGQPVDERPTWRRETMLVHLYLRRHPHSRQRYLIPALWPEAEGLLRRRGIDPETAEWSADSTEESAADE